MSHPHPSPSPRPGRRAFLRGAGLAALATVGAAGLAGCRSAVAVQADADAAAGTTTRGGTLRVGQRGDLSPAQFLVVGTGAGPLVTGLVYDTLTRYPLTALEPQPQLARSWQLAADGLSLGLDLRDDVRFHTGRPFTAADAEFSLRTYADPRWTAQLRSTAAAITDYEIPDPHRLVLHFAAPLGNIFDLLDLVPILDRESFADFTTGANYIGTGPFRLTSRTPNSRIEFERNEHYWQPGRPYLDRVEAAIIPDAQAQLNALRSGQIDYTGALSYRDSQRIGRTAGFATTALDGAESQIYVGANVTAPGLGDVRVRRAIAYALDRNRVMADVYRGTGYPVNLPWPTTSPAYDAARNATYCRDVGRAMALLAQAGAVPELPLTYIGAEPSHQAVAQIVQSNLADAGLRVRLDPVEQTVFLKQLIGAKFPGLWVTGHSFTQFEPSTLAVSAYPFNAAKNASRFSSPAYTAAATSAWHVADPAGPQSRDRYSALSDQLLDALFLIEIGVVVPQIATAARVRGTSARKGGQPDFTGTYLT
ncbi:ABC transporter substrate-binding protein [Speluncibacter jeojiensis]|uniref:ABC transporter substrate-binding protein n=1 Tax=Speluncibacter jeojiensis TaxID=2710754 RepID=A0A9X4LZH8_9ACTN|nr:ABC transporter substrate-binding protein [Corynebacteriales bacterium D3-21]